MSEDDGRSPTRNGDEDEAIAHARRRLLRLGAYAAPVVLGTLLTSRDAAATPGSYSNCCPNKPQCGPFGCAP